MARDVNIIFRPLTHWPNGRERTNAYGHEDAKFSRGEWTQNVPGDASRGSRYSKARTPLTTTLRELEREMYSIDVRDCVVQVDVAAEKDLRRSEIRNVRSPAVVVSFTRNGMPLTFAADYFKRWEDNLRSIVLGLEGLRRMERYHIAQSGDQYRGWQALPASTAATLSTEDAAKILAGHIGGSHEPLIVSVDRARDAARLASARTHPDRGGSTFDFQRVQEAKRILGVHFGAML